MWSNLKKRYAVANAPKIHQLKASLADCKQGGMIVVEFYSKVMNQFLLGLNDETYANIQSQILAQEPLPSLDKIFNMVSQEENHKNLMFGREDKGERENVLLLLA